MDNLDKLSILVDKERCQQALTNADEFEEALGVLVAALDDRAIPPTAIWAANRMAAAIRELHARLRTAQARLVSARILANEQRIYDDLLATAKAEGAAAREDVAQLEKWLNEDPEMRLAEVLVGESYRWCARLEQLVFDEPGSMKFSAEAGTFSEALRAAIDSARAGGGK